MLTNDELIRYVRQIQIYGFGEAGQEKLKQAKIIIAGIGGLGSSAAMYLTAAGVGTIRIIDHDIVETNNLNRQVLHWERDISKRKVESAIEKLNQLNPHVSIEGVNKKITEDNVFSFLAGFDLIIDALDSLATRFILNKAVIENNMPFIHGAVHGFEGRVTTVIPRETACLSCIYHGSIPEEVTPIIGVTASIIGSIQATEAIKYIVGIGKLLSNRLLVYDGLSMRFTEFNLKRYPNCEVCGSVNKEIIE